MKNQYFQLEFRGQTACLHIYPPEEDGQMLTISEVTEYLANQKLDKYDLRELNTAIVNKDGEIKTTDTFKIIFMIGAM